MPVGSNLKNILTQLVDASGVQLEEHLDPASRCQWGPTWRTSWLSVNLGTTCHHQKRTNRQYVGAARTVGAAKCRESLGTMTPRHTAAPFYSSHRAWGTVRGLLSAPGGARSSALEGSGGGRSQGTSQLTQRPFCRVKPIPSERQCKQNWVSS